MKLPDIAQLNPELGGILFFKGLELLINRSCFIGNTGFKGGSIYFSDYYYFEIAQRFVITESYFKGNRGNNGAAIAFSSDLKFFDAVVSFCLFISNYGKSSFFLDKSYLFFY